MSLRQCECNLAVVTALCKVHKQYFCPVCVFNHVSDGESHSISKVQNILSEESLNSLGTVINTRVRAIKSCQTDLGKRVKALIQGTLTPWTASDQNLNKEIWLSEPKSPQEETITEIKTLKTQGMQNTAESIRAIMERYKSCIQELDKNAMMYLSYTKGDSFDDETLEKIRKILRTEFKVQITEQEGLGVEVLEIESHGEEQKRVREQKRIREQKRMEQAERKKEIREQRKKEAEEQRKEKEEKKRIELEERKKEEEKEGRNKNRRGRKK
jgi:hypothetical protein